MNSLVISRLAKIYLFLLPLSERLTGLPKPYGYVFWSLVTIWRAIWLGLLDASSLNEINWSFYTSQTGFESEDFNINQGLWPWEAKAIRDHLTNVRSVLVAGAGGGREMISLARLGFEVTGFDFSDYLVDACRNNLEKAGLSADIILSPPDILPPALGVYDSLLIGRGFYHHIPNRLRRVKFLSLCCRHLPVGAPIILSDFFIREDRSKFYFRTKLIADFFRKWRRNNEFVELGDSLTNTLQHAFSRKEIECELLDAGIQIESYRASPFSETSRLMHVLGRVEPLATP
jgi:2-polyprenyl-3-methyl-5-hydroxy-6-metoxy-1,4-benzoquinol methylase